MGRPRAPHGTAGAYRRHKDMHEPFCEPCKAWKEAVDNDTAPPKTPKTTTAKTHAVIAEVSRRLPPAKKAVLEGPPSTTEHYKVFDPILETRRNIELIDRAMDVIATEDVSKLAPLSKRKSELTRELIELGGAEVASTAPVDPLDSALTGGVTLDNVTRITG